MKSYVLLFVGLLFFVSLQLSAQEKGMVFVPTDTTQTSINNQGVFFLQSDLENSSVWLGIQPHPLKSDALHLNIIINFKQQDQSVSFSPNDIELKVKNKKQEQDEHCIDPQLIADEIAYKKACFENSAHLTQVQVETGIIGLAAEKKKLRKSVAGSHHPSEYALLENTVLNMEKPSCIGLVIAPKISKTASHITVRVPVGKFIHEFNFDLFPSNEVDNLSSPLSLAYLSAINDADDQMKQVKSNTMNIAANAFNQGIQQSAQTTSPGTTNQTAGTFSSTGGTLGTIVEKDANGLYRPVPKVTCNSCKGSGYTNIAGITTKCPRCHGKGYIGH